MPFNPATGQWVPDDESPYEPPLQPPPVPGLPPPGADTMLDFDLPGPQVDPNIFASGNFGSIDDSGMIPGGITPPPPDWSNPPVPPEVLPQIEGAEGQTPWADSMAGVSSAIDAQSPYGPVPEQVMNQDRLNALRQQEWQAMQQFPQLGNQGPPPPQWSY